MHINSNAIVAAAFVVGAAGLSGCATKGFVRQNVAVVDQKVTADRARMDTMDQATRDAMARAEAAGKLAEGKFLYSMVLSDDSVKFPLDSSQLSPEAQTRLADFVQKLKADNKNVYLEIQGHTDSTGTKDLNLRLGEARAEAVRRYMNQQGVPLNRMATISYGQDDPVAPNDTRQGRAQNRRVVLIVMA
jgi:outer membrane protein OmpA-like peptidoglycan-associated protein